VYDPKHGLRVQAAVALQITPDPLSLSVAGVSEIDAQELMVGLPAFLDLKVIVALANKDRPRVSGVGSQVGNQHGS
jgi:hypothetical protein